MKNTTGRLLLIIIVSTAVNGKLAKQTVNYDREIKVYQFESVQVKEQGEIVFSRVRIMVGVIASDTYQ